MKKLYLFLFLAVFFSSCKKKSSEGQSTHELLEGKWTVQNTRSDFYQNNKINNTIYPPAVSRDQLTFKKNNTGIVLNANTGHQQVFSYTLSGDTLTIASYSAKAPDLDYSGPLRITLITEKRLELLGNPYDTFPDRVNSTLVLAK